MSPFALRPSAAPRWVKCGGYVTMVAKHPERPVHNLVREEGNAFHQVAAIVAKGDRAPEIGALIGDNVDYDETMADHVAEYVDEIKSWGTPAFIEQPMACTYIHPQCGGTPDGWTFDIQRRKIRLIDAKYGYRPVDPVGSLQLGCYLAGILERLQSMGIPMNGLHEQYWDAEFVIYQPRGRNIGFKRWEFNIAEYARGLFNVLKHAAHNAMTPGAPLCAGPHCLDCSAAADCPALRANVGGLIDVLDVTHSDPLSPIEIGYELDLLDYAESIIKARKEALTIEGEYRISQGTDIPGRRMSANPGRRRWIEGSEEQVIQMAAMLGYGDIAAPTKPITPTQAIPIIGRALVEQFSYRPQGKLKLSPLTASDIRKAFGK